MTYALKQVLYLCTSASRGVPFNMWKAVVVGVTEKKEALAEGGAVQTTYNVRTLGGVNSVSLEDLATQCEIFTSLDDAKAYLTLQAESMLNERAQEYKAIVDSLIAMMASQGEKL